jgi:site-specific DNA-methyltransferase (adenine-specific)
MQTQMNFENKIICGDSLKVLKEMPNDFISLIITSPPYFQQREYGTNIENGIGIGNEATEEEYLKNLLDIFFECVRITKPKGTIVFNIGDKYINGGLSLIPYKFAIKATENKKVFLVNNLTWNKINPAPRQDRSKLVQSTEPFFIFAKERGYYFNQDAYLTHLDYLNKTKRNKPTEKLGSAYYKLIEESNLLPEQKDKARNDLNNVIQQVISGEIEGFRMKIKGIHSLPYGGQEGGRMTQITNNGFTIIKIWGNKIKKDIIESPVETIKGNEHPAVYPQYIIQEIVKLLSIENDIILDPFSGSGTTCMAAKCLNRKYIGIEINKEYIDFSHKRLSEKNKELQTELFI